MRDREDATVRPLLDPPTRLTIALAALAGAALGALCALLGAPSGLPLFEGRVRWDEIAPTLRDWPRPPRPGESAVLMRSPEGTMLVVRAPRAPRVRELAAELATRRAGGGDELAAAARTAEARWRSRLAPAPLPLFSPTADCASWLLARAGMARDLATELPARYAGPAAPPPSSVPAALTDRLADVDRAAVAADTAALRGALLAELGAEDAWFAGGVPGRGAPAAARGAAWRAWQLALAESLEERATTRLATETPLQQSLAHSGRDARILELAAARPRPFAALLSSTPAAVPPAAAPLARAWARLLGSGALLGALVGGVAALAGAVARRSLRAPEFSGDSLRDPGARGPWLHLVAGPTPFAVSRAAFEVAAHALARRERVLIVDASPRLRLHERLEREARWGLMECLLADMPVLGLIQYGGRPGLYLLAHGNAGRGDGWLSLGRRLDDVRPHFGRVILAIDSTAPRALGEALAGRSLEGWWAESFGAVPRGVIELSARLGIAFSGLNLSWVSEASLEALSERVEGLEEAGGQHLLPQPAAALPPCIEALPEVVPEDIVLDCDLQVRQRLRFLAWMRRVQSETRTTETPAGTLSS